MSDTVLAALIAAGATLLVNLVNNAFQKRKADAEQDKRIEELKHEYEKQIIQLKSEFDKSLAELSAVFQQSIAVLDCKFGEMVKKIEKHNQIVERTYALESKSEVVEEKLKVVNHRIEDIEKKVV